MGTAKDVGKLNQQAISEAKSQLKNALGKARKFGSTVSNEVRAMRNSARALCRKEVAKLCGPRLAPAGVPVNARMLAEEFSAEKRFVRKSASGTNKTKWTLSKVSSKIETIDIQDFERSLVSLTPSERVAKVLEQSRKIAQERGWIKTDLASRNGGREIYFDKNLKKYYAVDTQHGRFELLNKRGKHLGELKMDLSFVKNSIDKSGGHDIFI